MHCDIVRHRTPQQTSSQIETSGIQRKIKLGILQVHGFLLQIIPYQEARLAPPSWNGKRWVYTGCQ